MNEERFVSKSAVRLFLRKEKMRVSSDLMPALDEEIQALLKRAAKRAGKNGRSTVMSQDL